MLFGIRSKFAVFSRYVAMQLSFLFEAIPVTDPPTTASIDPTDPIDPTDDPADPSDDSVDPTNDPMH